MKETISKATEQLQPLDMSTVPAYPEPIVGYFEYYGLNPESRLEGVRHYFGTFESDGQTLAGHIYKPQKYKGTVFVLHGYFDHCGQLSRLIKHLITAGYAVAAFDLPGHGLSTGGRAAIDDFSRYSAALSDFVSVVGPQLNGPYSLIAHSTGAAAALDYLLCRREAAFEKVILAAPLLRSAAWKPSKISYYFYSPFFESLPRKFRRNSSDKEFLDFVRNKDPLQNRRMPLKWVEALYEWNKKMTVADSRDGKIFIIQGTADTTVAWRYNIKFIRAKFTDVDVCMITKGRHALFNESAELRKIIFSLITDYLEMR